MTTEQKVSVLQKLRGRLIEQRERFMQYLGLLDQEQAAVERGDTERLQQQLDTEQLIVSEIDSFQRAIEPLEELYNRAYPRRELEIPPLRSALQSVQKQVREKVQRNARFCGPMAQRRRRLPVTRCAAVSAVSPCLPTRARRRSSISAPNV